MLAFVCVACTQSVLLGQATAETVVYKHPSLYLYKDGQLGSPIYSDGEIFAPFPGRRIPALAPGGRYVAFITCSSENKGALNILTQDGHVLYKETEVYDFSWSPDGDALVYSRGDVCNYGTPEQSRGVYIYNVKTGGKKQIEADRARVAVRWMRSDNCIYIDGGPVIRYDPASEEKRNTEWLGLGLSPDGKYYFLTGMDTRADEFPIYRCSDNKDVSRELVPPGMGVNGYGIQWLSNTHVVFYWDRMNMLVVLNTKKRTLRRLPQEMHGYLPGKDILLTVNEQGECVRTRVDDLPEIKEVKQTNTPTAP